MEQIDNRVLGALVNHLNSESYRTTRYRTLIGTVLATISN